MILVPILSTLVLAVAATWRGYRPVAAIACATALLALLALSGGPLPSLFLDRLQEEPRLDQPAWGRDNVIVVIGIGTVRAGEYVQNHVLGFSRVFEAARLFASCRAERRRCLLVTSGGDVRGTGEAEARVMARDLETLGVPHASILVEDQSRNTYENARLTKRLLVGNRFDRLVLVTSGFHLRRSKRLFRFFFDDVAVAPADHLAPSRGWWPQAATLAFVDIALHELAGELQFDLYNYMGWNTR